MPHVCTSGCRALFGLLTVLAVASSARAAEERRPNVVLIMADDMGYECVGANGGTSYRTPHLDRLASSGLRFEHAYSQPLCTPSRVQLMTGIYNQKNYVRFGLLAPDQTTFAQLLKQAGYATCIAGKWQLEGGFEGPQHFGFDEYCLWQLTRRPGRYPNPGLEINGREVNYSNGEYGPKLVNDYLCDFIERHQDGPFLAYYPMILPHGPYEPTPDSAEWDPKAEGNPNRRGERKFFADMVAYVDKMVGRVVAKLDELGLRENTLVIFTCDNGTGQGVVSRMGERVVHGGKGETTDAGTHATFIASWPGTIKPGVSQALVDFSDVLPTLCELAGAEVPRDLPIDGQSLLPVLRGEKESVREWTYCWYARNGGPTGKEFARDRRFKLYRGGKLYDIAADPLEQTDLLAAGGKLSPEAKASRDALQKVLDRYEGTRHVPDATPAKPKAKKPRRKQNQGERGA